MRFRIVVTTRGDGAKEYTPQEKSTDTYINFTNNLFGYKTLEEAERILKDRIKYIAYQKIIKREEILYSEEGDRISQ